MDEPFYINLTNPSTGELVFTTQNTDFLYTDVFIGFGGYFPLQETSAASAAEYLHRHVLPWLVWRGGNLYMAGETGAGSRVVYPALGLYPLDLLCINPHGYAPHPKG